MGEQDGTGPRTLEIFERRKGLHHPPVIRYGPVGTQGNIVIDANEDSTTPDRRIGHATFSGDRG